MSTGHTASASRIAREIAAELREHGDRWWPGFRSGTRGAVQECLGWHIQEHGGDAETLRVFGFDSAEAVIAWNDHADVTVEDVIALCDDVAALSDEPVMPMLPNDYHPGPRCSCRECLERFK